MWVAIDCRSKNWVAVLTSLGSTALHRFYINYDEVLPTLEIDQQNSNEVTAKHVARFCWWISHHVGVNSELRYLYLSQTIPRYRQERSDVTLAAIFADIQYCRVAGLGIFVWYIWQLREHFLLLGTCLHVCYCALGIILRFKEAEHMFWNISCQVLSTDCTKKGGTAKTTLATKQNSEPFSALKYIPWKNDFTVMYFFKPLKHEDLNVYNFGN
jgi:hypothetical protein